MKEVARIRSNGALQLRAAGCSSQLT